jgi:hypothetical protein
MRKNKFFFYWSRLFLTNPKLLLLSRFSIVSFSERILPNINARSLRCFAPPLNSLQVLNREPGTVS